MNAENICVVLCHPDESRNVGSVCRAMANNDVTELRIVGKKSDYDEIQVKTLSIHAYYIWENAKFFDTLTHINFRHAFCFVREQFNIVKHNL